MICVSAIQSLPVGAGSGAFHGQALMSIPIFARWPISRASTRYWAILCQWNSHWLISMFLAGSLYHFHQKIDLLFDRISRKTNRLILSKPVINLSSSNIIVGRIARKLANPGTGPTAFRFNEKSLIDTLKHEQARTQCGFRVISRGRDLVVEICFRQMEQA